MRSLLCLLLLASVVCGYEKDMTVTVAAGSTDCFYHDVDAGEVIDIDYQVIDASHGALEVSFQLAAPSGRVLVAELRRAEGAHRHPAAERGAYRLCFDNTFSTFSTKTVFFDLLVQKETDASLDYDVDDARELELGGADAAESYMMRVRDIAESVARVREHVASARRLQELHSAHEARDRNLAEGLCTSVLQWSLWQIGLMLLVGITQVIFVKSLFEETHSTTLRHLLARCLR